MYTVTINETLTKCVLVDADNEHEAVSKVLDAYNNGKIVLNSDDYIGETNFDAMKTTTPYEHKYFKRLEEYLEEDNYEN